MAVTISGDTGISAVQAGAVESGDLPSGSLIQVVQNTYNTTTSITSTSYTDSGLSASITPTSASNKILVTIQLCGRYYTQTNAGRDFFTNIVRDSTQIHFVVSSNVQSGTGTDGFAQYPVLSSLIYLDSPSTTSLTTYKVQAKVNPSSNSTTIRFNDSDNGVSTITLMEIAG